MARHDFHDLQRAYTRDANPDHYAWQTRSPYFAEQERGLLEGISLTSEERLLEIGCGEGGNLYHLRGQGRLRVGADFSAKKAAFAARHAEAHGLCADAQRLPFADGAFDVILIRDLLHHVRERGRVLSEVRRLLRSGGRLLLIEPNGRAPLILLQAALVVAERGVLSSTADRLRGELEAAGLRVESHRLCQPLPLSRVLLHPKLPLHLPVGLVQKLDGLAAHLVPRRAWTYLVYRAVK